MRGVFWPEVTGAAFACAEVVPSMASKTWISSSGLIVSSSSCGVEGLEAAEGTTEVADGVWVHPALKKAEKEKKHTKRVLRHRTTFWKWDRNGTFLGLNPGIGIRKGGYKMMASLSFADMNMSVVFRFITLNRR